MNGFIVFVIVAAYCWNMAGNARQHLPVFALVAVALGIAGVKVIDLILSMTKGLAVVVVAFALANPALVLLWSRDIAQAMAALCAGRVRPPNPAAAAICTNIDGSIVVAALAVLAVTLLLYWPQLMRGLSDVGFIGTRLRGERARRQRL